jgi:pyruvate/2-oxoglutarate dehydrogenase complex dihydrolipoamide dehydrogenase (E3) component
MLAHKKEIATRAQQLQRHSFPLSSPTLRFRKTETEDEGIKYEVGGFMFTGEDESGYEGFVKILTEAQMDIRIFGVHIMGPNASEMIVEGVLAIERCEDDTCSCEFHNFCFDYLT